MSDLFKPLEQKSLSDLIGKKSVKPVFYEDEALIFSSGKQIYCCLSPEEEPVLLVEREDVEHVYGLVYFDGALYDSTGEGHIFKNLSEYSIREPKRSWRSLFVHEDCLMDYGHDDGVNETLSGNLFWEEGRFSRVIRAMVSYKDMIYFSDYERSVWIMNPDTGNYTLHATRNAVVDSFAVHNSSLYEGHRNGEVYSSLGHGLLKAFPDSVFGLCSWGDDLMVGGDLNGIFGLFDKKYVKHSNKLNAMCTVPMDFAEGLI